MAYMKTISADLRAALAQDTTTIATGWRVIRVDGEVFGFTDHDEDVTIDGVTYYASGGLVPSATTQSDNFQVGTMDVTIFLTVTTEAEIRAGMWDNALVTVFEYDWSNPPAAFGTDVLVVRHGNLGIVKRMNNVFTAEVRGLTQRLARTIGRAYSPTCPWRHALWNGSTYEASTECGVSLSGMIHAGTVTAVDSSYSTSVFTMSTLQAAAYFNEGLITFTDGDNRGITREIRSYAVSGEVRLYLPYANAVTVGDAYSVVRGDDKRHQTCKDTFDNLDNFGGFPHIPGIMNVYRTPVLP